MLFVTRMLYQWIRNPDQCLQMLEILHVTTTPDLSAIDDNPSGCAVIHCLKVMVPTSLLCTVFAFVDLLERRGVED